MKPRRKKTIALLAALAVVAILAGVMQLKSGPKEAYYRSKSATSWLNELATGQGTEPEEAQKALRAMGPNAYPVLLEALGHPPDSFASLKFRAWLPSIPFLGRFLPRPTSHDALHRAALGIILSTDTTTATPDLLQLLEPTNREVREQVLSALQHKIGPANRDQASILVPILNDPAPGIRALALDCLVSIGPGASNAIAPACKNRDPGIRITAAWALWRVTHETNTAAPVLEAALSGPDAQQRHWAASYLQEMAGKRPALMSVFLQSLTNSNVDVRVSACPLLGAYGSDAKAAVPDLLAAFKDPDPAFRESAKAALRAIDPETAATVISQ